MSRILLTVALILALPLLVFCQSSDSSTATLQQNFVQVSSIPASDKLDVEKPVTVKSNSKAGIRNHEQNPVDEDESQSRLWGSAEYLLWRLKKSNLPPLITIGPDTGDAIIGQPGTAIAFGGSKLNRGQFPGARFTVGVWLNEKRNVGVEVGYFFLQEKTFNFQVSSSGQPGSVTISRPFINVLTQREDVLLIAFPQFSASGSSTANLPSKLQGAEANLIYGLNDSRFGRPRFLVGFRYLNLNEGLTITDITDVSTTYDFNTDQFSTRNQFYGGQVGAHFSFERQRLSLELEGRIAIGSNRQSVEINGASFSSVNLPHNFRGDVLALVSNIGQYNRKEFTVVPEVKAQFAFKFASHLRAFVGYDFLYWNKVVRPGEQIDRVVNPNLVPHLGGLTVAPPLRPAFSFKDTGFWVQGLNIGIQTRF